jgi:hypothetical protein
MPSMSAPANGSFYRMSDQVDSGKLAGMSGSHRPDGLFVLNGSGVRGLGRIEGARIADMAPTLLDLAGADMPLGLDGMSIESRDRERPAEKPSTPGSVDTPQSYTIAEEREIADRLEALGYLG